MKLILEERKSIARRPVVCQITILYLPQRETVAEMCITVVGVLIVEVCEKYEKCQRSVLPPRGMKLSAPSHRGFARAAK
jgi:hypothetical protein